MKKLLSIISAACIALSLTGCAEEITMEDCVQSSYVGYTLFNPIMGTENGYYYNELCFGEMSLRHYDIETGKDISLCSKPECQHDGNMYCVATNNSFRPLYTTMYGGEIYIAASFSDGEHTDMKLMKITDDGTELSEIAVYLNLINNQSTGVFIGQPQTMVIHRGYALIPYSLHNGDIEASSFGAALVELSTGKVTKLNEYTDTNAYKRIAADGDYFYWINMDNSKRINELYRYNYLTDTTELLNIYDSHKAQFGSDLCSNLTDVGITSFAVINGLVYYANYTVFPDSDGRVCHIYTYDPENDTTKELSNELASRVYIDDINELGYIETPVYKSFCISTDGTYLYAALQDFTLEYLENDPCVFILDTDGHKLGYFEYDRNGAKRISVSFINGNAYVQTEEKTVFCPVSDIIAENTEWTELYRFENEQ